MTREAKLSACLVAVFIVTFGILCFLQAGFLLVAVISGSMTVAFFIWLFTTAKRPADPRIVLPYYLAALALLYLHILEEYATDFAGRIGALFHSAWTSHDHALVFGTIGPMIWTVMAVGVWYRKPLPNYFVLFIFVGMFAGELTHVLLFPVLEASQTGRYGYFPGMWTSLLPLVPSIAGLIALVRDHRRATATAS
jgi:hypothetical protein